MRLRFQVWQTNKNGLTNIVCKTEILNIKLHKKLKRWQYYGEEIIFEEKRHSQRQKLELGIDFNRYE